MKFLYNTWYVAASSGEVGESPLIRTILNQEIVIFRGEANEPIALGNICPHRYAKLGKGKIFGDTIECPYHGLRFGQNGKCVHNPHGSGKLPNRGVKAYPLEEKYGFIWIWMGDSAKTNPDDIPDYSILVDENYATVHVYLEINANYQLLADNLLDLSHIQFLHPYLSDPEWVKKSTVEMKMDGNNVICKNRAKDLKIIGINRFIMPDALPVGDTHLDMIWHPPSNLLLHVRYINSQDNFHHALGHILTPETESTTHYFIKSSYNHRINDGELSNTIRNNLLQAFSNEDEPMLADQQEYLGSKDLHDTNPVSLESDAAGIRARRILSKLIKMESS